MTSLNPQSERLKIAVILFTKDEENHITEVITELKHFLQELPPSKLFIYDDSSDNTGKIAENLGVTTLKGFKIGLGWAYYTALKSLSATGKFQTVITLDGDGQTNLSELPSFYKEFKKGYDLVVGSRFLKKGSFAYQYPKINFFGAKALSFLITFSTFQKFTDSHGGMRIMTSQAAENPRFIGTHSYVQETLIEAVKKDCKVREIPCFWRKRNYEKSRVVNSYLQYARKMGLPLFVRTRLYWPVILLGCLTGFFLQKPFLFMAFFLAGIFMETWKTLKFSKNRKQLDFYANQLIKKNNLSTFSGESDDKN